MMSQKEKREGKVKMVTIAERLAVEEKTSIKNKEGKKGKLRESYLGSTWLRQTIGLRAPEFLITHTQ